MATAKVTIHHWANGQQIIECGSFETFKMMSRIWDINSKLVESLVSDDYSITGCGFRGCVDGKKFESADAIPAKGKTAVAYSTPETLENVGETIIIYNLPKDYRIWNIADQESEDDPTNLTWAELKTYNVKDGEYWEF